MAVSSIAVPADPKRDARARVLAGHVGAWPRFTLKQPWGSFSAGTTFRRAPSSKGDGTRYLVNAVACQCPDYAERGNICKHVRAFILWEQRQQRPAPTRRPSYADLFPACQGCGDVAEGKDGLCHRCASEREWSQRRESARQHVAVQIDAGVTFADAHNPLAE
jgi:hypothetical protein